MVSRWYAVQTRSNFEPKVYQCLRGRSIEALLPRIQVMSRRKDRRKKIRIPLFPGYVFVKTDLTAASHLAIVQSVGVVRMVGFQGRPVPVSDEEISNLIILDGTEQTIHHRNYLKAGDKVAIIDGPLSGLVGVCLYRKGKAEKIVVSVEFLMRSVEVELHDWAVEKVT